MEDNSTMGQETPDWGAWQDEHGPRLLLYARQRPRSLAGIFGAPGLVLHGGTPIAERQQLLQLVSGSL